MTTSVGLVCRFLCLVFISTGKEFKFITISSTITVTVIVISVHCNGDMLYFPAKISKVLYPNSPPSLTATIEGLCQRLILARACNKIMHVGILYR